MTPEEKRLKITTPIPLEKALNIYGVNSEAELMNLFKEKLNVHKKNFLTGDKKKSFNFFRFWKKS